MSKITFNNLSSSLKEYLNTLGITEEQVINIINENLPQDLVERVDNIELNFNNLSDEVNNLKNDTSGIDEVKASLAEMQAQVDEFKNDVKDVKTSLSNIQNKVINIMVQLNIADSNDVDEAGYWFDGLADGENIVFIDGIVLDVDRHRIFGAPGSVIFKELNVPFVSTKVKAMVDMDDNFIENLADFTASAGSTVFSINQYSYEIK